MMFQYSDRMTGGDAMRTSMMRRCQRCGGLMYLDKYFDRNETFLGLRCIICGDIIDPVILENRKLTKADHEIQTPSKQSGQQFMLEEPEKSDIELPSLQEVSP